VAYLDDDDLWSPRKLRSQLDAAERVAAPWVLAGAVSVDEQLRIVGGGRPAPVNVIVGDLPLRNMVVAGSSNVVARRSLVEATGGFDATLRHMADWDLWIRMAQHGAPAVVERPLVAYLQHSNNASRDWRQIPDELDVLERRYEDARHGRPVDAAYVYRWIAWNALRTRDRRTALRWYGAAIRTGDFASIARAVIGTLAPGVSSGTLARHRPDRAWIEDAQVWLAQVAP
jgi:hypothetical protein